MMKANPILEEVWKIKDDLDREANHDLHHYCENLRKWVAEHPPSGPIVRNAAELRQLMTGKEVGSSALVLKESQSPEYATDRGEMFTREFGKMFTPRSQQVLKLAREEAKRLNDNVIGVEHVLLGLIALGQGVAATVLIKKGFNLESVRKEIERLRGKNPEPIVLGQIPYTPRVKKVMERAEKEAEAFHHTFVGTEHLLLALLCENEGLANKVFKVFGLDTEQARKEIQRELAPDFP